MDSESSRTVSSEFIRKPRVDQQYISAVVQRRLEEGRKKIPCCVS